MRAQTAVAENRPIRDAYTEALNAHAIFSATDKHGILTYVNDNFCRFFQFSREELIGQSHKIVSSGVHPKGFWQEAWEKISAGHSWSGQVCNRRKDGSLCWLQATIVPCLDEQGNVIEYLSVRSDITEQKNLENKLLRSTMLLQKTNLAARIGAWELNLETQELYWSKVTRLIHEIPEDFAPSVDKAVAFYPEGPSRDAINKALQNAIEKGESWDLEVEFETYKQRRIWVHAIGSPEFIADKCVRLYGTFQDITQRRKSEILLDQKTRETEQIRERLELATQTAGVAIWDWDLINDTLIWDDQMFQLYGVEKEGFNSTIEDWRNCFHPDDLELAENALREAIHRNTDFSTGFRIRLPDGTIRHLRAFGTIHYMPGNIPSRMIGTNWDVTDDVLQKERLKILATKAEQSNKAKSEFLANMSHEIRTPMNGVIGMAHLLLQSDELTDEQRLCGETIQSSAECLMALINDILDFSKAEAGKLELESTPFDLNKVIDEVSSITAFKAQEKSIEFITYLAPEIPRYLIGDHVRYRQILLNLIGNAIKFTEEGEVEVTFSLEKDYGQTIHLNVAIRDTGIGISPEQSKLLFTKFTQADASVTRKFGGTGLGLAICKQLTEIMGGKIHLISELGFGTTFEVSIPFEKQSQLTEEVDLNLNGLRVLIGEDNHYTRKATKRLLSALGANVVEAAGGANALEIIFQSNQQGERFDFVMLDVDMKPLSGLMLAKTLRAQEPFHELPILLTSNATSRFKESEIKSLCCVKNLRKPILKSDLDAIIPSLFGCHHDTKTNPSKAHQRRHPKKNIRILVAEDNRANQIVVKGHLEHLGFKYTIVENGEQAFQAVSIGHYDLVLMDVQMPVLDGLSATRKIRSEIPEKAKLPIIALTAHAFESDRQECLEAGMNDYLSKPILPEAIAKTLERWLPPSACPSQALPSPINPSSESELSAQVFERDMFLKMANNDESFAREVAREALEVFRKAEPGFDQAVAMQHKERLFHLMHDLKAISGTMQVRRLYELASQLETWADNGEIDRCAACTEVLKTLLAKTTEEIEDFIGTCAR